MIRLISPANLNSHTVQSVNYLHLNRHLKITFHYESFHLFFYITNRMYLSTCKGWLYGGKKERKLAVNIFNFSSGRSLSRISTAPFMWLMSFKKLKISGRFLLNQRHHLQLELWHPRMNRTYRAAPWNESFIFLLQPKETQQHLDAPLWWEKTNVNVWYLPEYHSSVMASIAPY